MPPLTRSATPPPEFSGAVLAHRKHEHRYTCVRNATLQRTLGLRRKRNAYRDLSSSLALDAD